ncbi:hypothetical protein BDL97_03G090400 [Sphagnum fallax]|jgi:hypothetical protein|nr:hypothetical protein BDL97_03G090400 [Sphagnum fallax]KAH8967708.1 hypothetical protein BDL97_03G090400 [Sphagnum fallax]KAH8967709.1 hypothetical protein BDL97_03G090400 [Sphagnum fallax]
MQKSELEGWRDFDLEAGILRQPRRGKRLVSGGGRMAGAFRQPFSSYQKLPTSVIICGSLVLSGILFILVFIYNQTYGPQFGATRVPGQIFSDYNSPFKDLHSLVMVAGHAVYTSSSCDKPDGEDAWFLEPYQKHPGQASTFVKHIKSGVEVASIMKDSLLLFSGGETRKDAGPRSEAQSYWGVAEAEGWFGKTEDVRWRALTEEHARDSFENLLFSICRFRELTGHYPSNITIVSYDFKESRFSELHRIALRFPASQFSFVGIPTTPTSQKAAVAGEVKVQKMFQEDPYGCTGSLRTKRIARDPFIRSIPYPSGCPEIRGLFSWCGTEFYGGRLPWDV